MKKLMILALLLALLLAGCGGAQAGQTPEAPSSTTTLMIYMVGSDLEAQAGAATRDLTEITESGVDLERVNVVVYAGGSPHWHNEVAQPEVHSVLWLTEDGFTSVATTPTTSMGSADCLANFLNYGISNFPADEYALILWDHGNGPVIGYGKDMLFDDDTLTLGEMQQALDATPFKENKLAWVGFDACLMASAELAHSWSPYAHYLVASQEVEPSFGWDYSFLSQLGQTETPQLLRDLTDTYLRNCLDYYESRGYEDRDTTLSCMDLSCTQALSEAINALFAAAAADADAQYNALTTRRAQTRALGRATTGSEYDLIDLGDLAHQFSDIYPQEAAQLQTALNNMVLANATNTQDLCGLSLYYPFYNKYYFEDSWWDIYDQLGLFPDYLTYLQSYQQKWLQNDLLEAASSQTPQVSPTGTYTLELTPQQQATFAEAKYYILVRDGQEYYTRIFESPDVTNEDGILTAGFDGNVLYVKDNYGNYQIPVTIAHDTVGDQSRYSVFVTLTNYSMSLASVPEDFVTQMQPHRFSLTLDNTTGQVTVSSLVPYDHKTDTAILTGGKLTDTQLEDWESCFFLHDDHRYLSRYENGAIMPVDQWPASTLFSGFEYPVADGLTFTSAPLAAGEYYLLFEVEDTQGNRYCSDLLPIETGGILPAQEPATPTDLSWTDGDRILVAEENGITVHLCKTTDYTGQQVYLLEASNQTDHPIRIQADDLYWNGDIFCDGYFGSVKLDPGETAQANYGSDLGAADELGMLSQSGQLQFSLTIQNNLTGAHMMYRQPYRITLSQAQRISANATSARYNDYHATTLGALAAEQTLLENEDFRVTLLGLGGNGQDSTLRGALCIENLTDQPLQTSPAGIVLNDIYVSVSSDNSQIPANSRTYRYFSVLDYYLRPSGITSVASAQLLMKQEAYSPLFTGNTPETLYWCDIALSQSTTSGPFTEGSQVLWEEEGIRVALTSHTATDSKHTWLLTLVNDTDTDVALDLSDIVINDQSVSADNASLHISHAQAGAHQKCVFELEYYYRESPLESAQFRFRIMDFSKEAIYYTGTETICLTP